MYTDLVCGCLVQVSKTVVGSGLCCVFTMGFHVLMRQGLYLDVCITFKDLLSIFENSTFRIHKLGVQKIYLR